MSNTKFPCIACGSKNIIWNWGRSADTYYYVHRCFDCGYLHETAEKIFGEERIIGWVPFENGKNPPPIDKLILAYYPNKNERGEKKDTTKYDGNGKLTDISGKFEATHWALMPGDPE